MDKNKLIRRMTELVNLAHNMHGDSGSCKGEMLRRLALGRAAMTGLNKIWKQRQRYNNYNKMQNSKCIRFPSSAVWL